MAILQATYLNAFLQGERFILFQISPIFPNGPFHNNVWDIGLAPNRQQASVWTNDGLVH